MLSTTALILAAGLGKRMDSPKSKVLHEVGGLPMLVRVYDAVKTLVNVTPVVVVSSNYYEVKNLMGNSVRYAVQNEPLGTGHAAMVAIDLLRGSSDQVIVMYGDMPLIRRDTIANLLKEKERAGATIAMMSIIGESVSTFGRITRNSSGAVVDVIEWADAKQRENASEILSVRELNAGLYCFDCEWFCENVGKIVPRPSRDFDEYYLTDIFRIASDQRKLVIALKADNNDEFLGVSTKDDLVKIEKIYHLMTHNSRV